MSLENHNKSAKRTSIKFQSNVVAGEIISSIKQEAKKIKANLIVMGTLGQNHNVLEKTIGTISSTITRNAPCPIILVPNKYKYKKIENAIFSTNLKTGDPYQLHRAMEVIKPQRPVVRCVYVNKQEKEGTEEISDFAKYMVDHSPNTRTIFMILLGNNIIERIVEQAETYNAEMIIMHKTKKSFWKRIKEKNHIKAMINLLNKPLLIMN